MTLLNLMGQSLTHLLVQAIFSTKGRRPFLRSEEIRNEIHAYIKASHWVGRPFRARRLISLPRAILLDRSAVIAKCPNTRGVCLQRPDARFPG